MSNSSHPRMYVEREIDYGVVEALRRGLQAKSRGFWITLVSAPGRGNTSLLEHLKEHLQQDYAFRPYETLLVQGSKASPGHEPGLGPLGDALYHKVASLGMSRIYKIRRRLRNASKAQLFICAVVILGSAVLACLFAGFAEYVTSMQGRRFGDFLSVYTPRHWPNFPLWLLTSSLGSLPISLGFLYISRKFLLPASAKEPGPGDIEELRTGDGLADALEQTVRAKRGVILLIDEAQWLPPIETTFLNGLLANSGDEAARVLIAALDTAGTDWTHHLHGVESEQLEVPPFELFELRSILNAHGKPTKSGKDQPDEADLCEQAEGNVKALLAHENVLVSEELGQEFRKASADDIGSVVGVSALIVLQAVRQRASITKTELLKWLTDEKACLKECGWIAPEGPQELVKKFAACSIVKTSGDLCRFDPERRHALQLWLQHHEPRLLARVHYFWCCSFVQQSQGPLKHHAVRSAAWHAARIALFLDKPVEVIQDVGGLSPEAARERQQQIATVLLAAAAVLRSEGDLLESRAFVIDGIEWLHGLGGASSRLAGEALDQLWRGYWLSGDARNRDEIERTAALFPDAAGTPGLRVHHRYEALLQGSASLPPLPEESLDPALHNLRGLTETLVQIRQAHGFLEPGLSDSSVSVAEPVESFSDTFPEIELWSLMTAACDRRNDEQGLQERILRWRARLLQHRSARAQVGEQVVGWLAEAFYYHRLADVLEHAEGGAPFRARRRQVPDSVADLLRNACLEAPEPDEDLEDFLWEQSRTAYHKASQLALLLGWRVVVLKAHFGLATLLERHTPGHLRQPEETWWEGWDALFNHCVQLEKELKWVFHRPILHQLRHEFFADEGLESSTEDAYNAFVAAKAAHYPAHVILEWHRKVAGLLNDYGNSDVDRRRSAELHELWARDLAALPEAEALLRFRALRYEQAYSLHYAAQALRLIRELDRADRLLNEADALVSSAPAGEPPEDMDKVRELLLTLRLQRAWLREMQGRQDEYMELVKQLWREMRRSDPDCDIVLRSLVQIEAEEGLLDDPWPALELVDPDNPEMSLPDSAPLQLENRFEFRLRQFLSLISAGSRASLPELMLFAQIGLGSGKSFGKTALLFAELGLALPVRPETRQLLINLLRAVWFFFAEIVEVETDELQALRLLLQYAPDNLLYHQSYAAAVVKNQHLLKRELAVQEAGEQDWLKVAQRVNHYLGILVDNSLRAEWIAAALEGSGISGDVFMSLLEKRRGSLQRARAALESGDPQQSLHHLASVLPSERPPWVFLEDLQVVDLWIRSQAAAGTMAPEEFSQRSRQLRELAVRFVRQFGGTISDQQVQHLVLDLVAMASGPEGVSPNAPVRAT